MPESESKMVLVTRRCQHCGTEFTITDRRALKKRFCSPSCRVTYSRLHVQRERDRARDQAYSELTVKDWIRRRDHERLTARVSELEDINTQLKAQLDEITSLITRMSRDHVLTINMNETMSDYYKTLMDQSAIDWTQLLNLGETVSRVNDELRVSQEETSLPRSRSWGEPHTASDDGVINPF